MKRSKELENSVKSLLDSLNISYMRVDNYRCFRCGQVQNHKAKGWPDFYCYYPFLLAIECKTGTGKLSKKQKDIRNKLIKSGTPYIVAKDNIDKLLKILKEKTGGKISF